DRAPPAATDDRRPTTDDRRPTIRTCYPLTRSPAHPLTAVVSGQWSVVSGRWSDSAGQHLLPGGRRPLDRTQLPDLPAPHPGRDPRPDQPVARPRGDQPAQPAYRRTEPPAPGRPPELRHGACARNPGRRSVAAVPADLADLPAYLEGPIRRGLLC